MEQESGLATYEENDTSCCYALQDKVWVHGPGREPWEVDVVKADATTLGKSPVQGTGDGDACCAATPAAADDNRAAGEAEPVIACGCGG